MSVSGGPILALAALAALPGLRELARKPMTRRARTDAPGQFAELPGGLTHYDWIGPAVGPVVVCIHGLTTPSFVWTGLAALLARQGYRVLIYDLYGRGYSDRPRGPQGAAFFTRQLRDLMDREGLHEDVALIGYSMGGAIATAFAAEEDHRLRRLILLAPAGMGHDLGAMAAFCTEWPLIGDWLFHMGYPGRFRRGIAAESGTPGSVKAIHALQRAELDRRGFVRSVLASLRGILRRPMHNAHYEIARRSLPVTAIWGREDTVIPLRAMGQLTQWNRAVHHVVLEDAGHGVPYTHTDAVARAILGTPQETGPH